MPYLNDSDMLSDASYETPKGCVTFPAHLRGNADSVAVKSIPSHHGNVMAICFRAEAGRTGAVIRVPDLIALIRQHHPELLEFPRAPPEKDGTDEEESHYRYR